MFFLEYGSEHFLLHSTYKSKCINIFVLFSSLPAWLWHPSLRWEVNCQSHVSLGGLWRSHGGFQRTGKTAVWCSWRTKALGFYLQRFSRLEDSEDTKWSIMGRWTFAYSTSSWHFLVKSWIVFSSRGLRPRSRYQIQSLPTVPVAL